MNLLTSLCSVPTAPFVEGRVISYVKDFVARHPKLRLTSDRFGNQLIELRGTARGGQRWIFAAHMDHPGFVAEKMTGPRTLEAAFRGGVKAEFFKGSKVRFFDGDAEVPGVVEGFEIGADRGYPERATV